MAVNIYEAKTQLSKLIERVEAGEEIIIARAGRPVARLAPLVSKPGGCRLGVRRGEIVVGGDFDDPLPDEIAAAFGAPTT